MKKLTNEQALQPLQKGRIRISIKYHSSGDLVIFEGILNPDRNILQIQKLLNRIHRASKPLPLTMSPREIEEIVAGSAA